MNTSHLDGPGTVQDAGQVAATTPPAAGPRERTPLLLWGVWLATAVGLVVAPFLTRYRVVSGYQDEAVSEGIPDVQREWSTDGWGDRDGIGGGHDLRIGVVLVAVAAPLVVAVVATIVRSRSRWPAWLGLLASTMSVTASALSLVDLEARRYVMDMDDATFRSDLTVGPGGWLVLVLGASAAFAVVWSLVRIRRRRRADPRRPTPTAPSAGLPLMLPSLWLVAAIGLAVAPFLTVTEVRAADMIVQLDGWGRTEGVVGVPCAILAGALAVAAIAAATQRTAILPLRIGLLAGSAAVVVSASLLVRLDLVNELAEPPNRTSIGFGAWLILAAGLLAAATVVLTLIRQQRLEVD